MTAILPVCVVAGVGPGIGVAYVRAFAKAGYAVAMLSRRAEPLSALADTIEAAHAYPCDLTEAASVAAAFDAIEAQLGPVEVLLFNAGKGVWGDIGEIAADDFEDSWRINTLGLFLAAKRVVPSMVAAGEGAIVVTGATASLRGGAKTIAFAPAKAAQRTLAQSLARDLGPKGVHVAHIVVDGVVGGPVTREQFADRADDRFVDPSAIAATALALVRQPRSAWSFEVDVRPFNESW